jgi:hypothetical protein
MPMRSVK